MNVIPSDADLEKLKTESQEAYEQAVAAAREQRAKLEKEAGKVADKASKDAKQFADKAEKEASKFGDKAQKFAKDSRKELEKDAEYLRKKGGEEAKKLKKAAHEAGEEIESFWNKFSSNPDYWVPTLAAVNVAVIGGVGLFALNSDNAHRWDKRVVSAVSVGILTLLGGQGYWAAETARKQRGRK